MVDPYEIDQKGDEARWENGQNGRVELYGIARRFSEQRTQRNEFASKVTYSMVLFE